MNVTFRELAPDECEQLVIWLSSDIWPWHVVARPTEKEARSLVRAGLFDRPANRTFWILDGRKRKVGIVALHRAETRDPVFDLRIRSAWRSRGIGRTAVNWLVEYVFRELPFADRLEAYTRADHKAMRCLLGSAGFVKEVHRRCEWPGGHKELHDSVGYSFLRSDFESGTTTPVNWDDETELA